MRIIDRYISNSVIKIFFSTVLIFCFLYILIDVTTQLDEFIDRKIPIPILIKYYINFFPVILAQTSSIACLIASLFTFSSLNNNNEVIALRSSGLNFWQITKPALFFALIVSASVFLLNERIIPYSLDVTNKIRDEYMVLKVDRIEKQNKIRNLTFYGLRNRLYFIDTYDPNTSELNGITIIEYDNQQNIQQKIVALRGVWTDIAWKFYNCQITSFEENNINQPVKVKVYDEKLMDIKETPQDFLRQRLNVSSMNIRQLHDYIGRFADSGATKALVSLRVDMHQKIAYPFGNFVIVLVGIPMALMVKNRKGMTFTSIGIAILIGFLYYVTNAVALAFGKGGLFPPILSAWATPLLFSSIALYTIEKNF